MIQPTSAPEPRCEKALLRPESLYDDNDWIPLLGGRQADFNENRITMWKIPRKPNHSKRRIDLDSNFNIMIW